MDPEAEAAARDAGVSFRADAESRALASRDFGGISEGRCLLAAEPSSPESAARLIAELRRRGIPFTVRGAGFSQGGQSVAAGTVSVSTRRLDRISSVDRERREVTVGAGATPRQLVSHLASTGLVPPVLPLNLDMTIGGLVSAGGVGGASHRHGAFISHVTALRIVTADGVLRVATAEENPDLFDAARAGAGRVGLIVDVTVALRIAPRRVRVRSFLYDDLGRFLEDHTALSDAHAGLSLEGFCWAGAKGMRGGPTGPVPFTQWSYGLTVGAGDDVPSDVLADALGSLRPARAFDGYETDFRAFLHRYEPRFEGMVREGHWALPHPWFEAIVPLDSVRSVLPEVLDRLPPSLGDGHRFTLLDATGCPPHFGAETSKRTVVIGVFPPSVSSVALPLVRERLAGVGDVVRRAGGRRYLSGYLGTEPPESVARHFGGPKSAWETTRGRHDPRGLFRSVLFPSAG